MTTHTPAPAHEAVLTDSQIELIRLRAEKDSLRFGRTVDIPLRADLLLGLLSKLRAPKPLGDACHHCGWLDWVSQDGAAYCQACGKPHGSVPKEGLPHLPELLRENADLDEAEGGNAQVCALERDAADEIERLRREVAKLRAPVADERAAFIAWLTDSYPNAYSEPEAVRLWHHGHVSALAWKERGRRAALASAPVSGEAQPVGYVEHSREYNFHACPVMTRVIEYPALRKLPNGTKLYAAPQASEAVRDAAFEAVRKRLCAIPRYSFYLDDDGVVRRVEGCSGNWIEFDAAHELFDPVAVDAALSAQLGAQKNGGSDAG